MPRCISFKEAHRLLTRAAGSFASPVKNALELWLRLAGEVERIRRHPCTAPVMNLVETALRQWSAQQDESSKVAWLQKHLPGISSAMYEFTTVEVHTSLKRINILQRLVNSTQQPEITQLRGTLHHETQVHIYRVMQAGVFFLVLPVGVLSKELLLGANMQVHRLQQGSDLISRVGLSLGEQVIITIELRNGLDSMHDDLEKLCATKSQVNEAVPSCMLEMMRLRGVASVEWIRLATSLPSCHPHVIHFLAHVNWSALRKDVLRPQELLQAAQSAVSLVVTVPQLLSEIRYQLQPMELQRLLLGLVITPEYLQALGPNLMPAAQAERILSVLQDTGSDVDPDACTAAASGSQHPQSQYQFVVVGDSIRLVRNRVENGAMEPDADEVAKPDLAAEVGGDLNDMNVLLRMMYGTSIC